MSDLVTKVRILGTNHISKSSARSITRAFEEFKPDIVAVELDNRRLQSLLEGEGRKARVPLRMAKHVGITGWLFLLVGSWMQRKLAGIVKVQPGVDMLTAVNLAKEHNKMLLLVDQDVMVTMRKLSRVFTFKEKMRLLWDLLTAPFQKEKIKIKLDTVPSAAVIKKLMTIMQERYPALYKVLVADRNVVMATKLDRITRTHPMKKVLLVVGAGHEEDLKERLLISGRFTVV